MRRKRGSGVANPCDCRNHVWAATTKVGVALVSPQHADILRSKNWSKIPGGYATTSSSGKTIYLHKLCAGPHEGLEVDHVNHNKLDNRIENIRLATRQQNGAWRKHFGKGLKGVRKHHHKWVARISIMGREIHLGSFETQEQAGRAYDAAAIKAYGKFAYTNAMEFG